jgi:hypothetical protein
MRLTRVALFALTAVALASVAHVVGGGPVDPGTALLAVPAVMVVVNLLGARRRGVRSLLPVMGLTQLALHLAFMISSVSQTCRVVAPVGDHPMVMPRATVTCGSAAGQPMQHGSAANWSSTAMTVAHVLATVLLVLVLAYGEAVVWALASCLGVRLAVPGPPALLPPLRPLRVAGTTVVRPISTVPRSGIRRRGPPRPSAVPMVCAVV